MIASRPECDRWIHLDVKRVRLLQRSRSTSWGGGAHGQLSLALPARLQGHTVRSNGGGLTFLRSGLDPMPEVEATEAHATDPAFVTHICATHVIAGLARAYGHLRQQTPMHLRSDQR